MKTGLKESVKWSRVRSEGSRRNTQAVIDNKHVLLPWLVMNAGAIITRYKTVNDGKTAYQRIKNKRPSNKMQPFGEEVVWMMPRDSHRRNKLDSNHLGVFIGIAP